MIKYLADTQIDFNQKFVLVSAVSTGNIPTLALDLLIIANGFKRVGFIHSDHLQPSVGYLNDKIEEGALGLPAQIYMKDNTIIIQLRSTVLFGRKKQFIQEISQIVGKKAEMIVMSSLPFGGRTDFEIGSLDRNIYYHAKQQSQMHVPLTQHKNCMPVSELINHDQSEKQVFSEGGLAKQMLNEENLGNVTALFVFGTQMQDKTAALFLAKAVRSTIGVGLNRKQLAQEPSLEMIQ